MMMCRISNTTSMSIVIEDIGVRLQPSGGTGSSATVHSDMVARSSDLKRHAQWLKIEEFDVVPAPPAPLPVLAPQIPTLPRKNPPTPASSVSASPAFISNQEKDSELERLRKVVDDMRARQEELFSFLRSSVQASISVPAVRTRETPIRVSSPDFSEDPIMLPGKVMPESVEVSVQTREDEQSSEGFNSTLAALKKAKGR
jgi:hypothetical protein